MNSLLPAETTGRFDRWFYGAANAFAVLGAVALTVLMGVTVVSVFWRYALRDPIFGIQDLSTMSLAVVVAAGVAYGAVHGAHISVNIISAFVGRKTTRFTDLVARGLSVATCGYAAMALAVKGTCGLACGAVTQNLRISHEPFYYLLSASLALVTAFLLYRMIVGLKNWSGEDPNEELA